MKPLTIAGGGLAGLSLGAGLLRRGVPVQLHEAAAYPRHRVCGEFICGVTDATLSNLGISGILDGSYLNQTSTWYAGERPAISRELPVPAHGLSRHSLDARLADRFRAAGGELICQSRHPDSEREGLVWASGRQVRGGSRWLGLKCHLRQLDLATDLEMYQGNMAYAGLSRIEDGAVNLCGLFRRRPSEGAKGRDLILFYLRESGLRGLADRVAAADMDLDSVTGISAFELGPQNPPQSPRLCLGDCFAMIGPFTGNGMSMAFESAEIALGPLEAYALGKSGWEETVAAIQKEMLEKFRHRLRLSAWVHPFLLHRAGQILMTVAARSGLLPFEKLFKALR